MKFHPQEDGPSVKRRGLICHNLESDLQIPAPPAASCRFSACHADAAWLIDSWSRPRVVSAIVLT
jgi:hypothetical protein